MNKTIIRIHSALLLVLLSIDFCWSQNANIEASNVFRKYVAEEIRYPIKDRSNIPFGVLVGGLDFQDVSNPKIIIINPLDESLNQEFKRVMTNLLRHYQISGFDSIIFHIEFRRVDKNYRVFMENKPDFVLFPIKVEGGIVSVPAFSTISNSIPPPKVSKEIDMDSKDMEKVKKLMEKENYEKSVEILNSMIQRNPYVAEYYYLRGLSNINLGKRENGLEDYSKLKNFLKCDKYDSDFMILFNN